MFDPTIWFLTSLLLLVLYSGTLAFIASAWYGDRTPPPRVARLIDLSTDIYAAAAGAIVGVLNRLTPNSPPPQDRLPPGDALPKLPHSTPPSLPTSDTKQITQQ